MLYFVTLASGREIPVEIEAAEGGPLRVTIEGRTTTLDAVPCGAALSVRHGDRVVDLWVEGAPPEVGVVAAGQRFYARVESERERALAATGGTKRGEGLVKSPMPGRILKLLVAEGDLVEVGSPLVVVEAMKMENELFSRKSGRVKKVFVAAGASVEGGAKLVEIE